MNEDGQKRVMVIDGYNFMHRARGGFNAGDYPVVFNFFRNLRALLERLPSDRILFVIEGVPKARIAAFPEYKANREIDPADAEALAQMASFHRQKAIILDLLRYFPITVVRHRDYECDDVIYTIVKNGPASTHYTVVSNDSDFTQMLDQFDNVDIYNPMLKEFVEQTPYDYVLWKALRGDETDNIPSLEAGLGDKTAADLVLTEGAMRDFLAESEERQERFIRNVELIRLVAVDGDEGEGWESSEPVRAWKTVEAAFNKMQFASILKQPYWDRFVNTFDHLFGV